MLISRYQNFLIKEDDDMDLLGFRRILDSTPFAVLAVAFGVLFGILMVLASPFFPPLFVPDAPESVLHMATRLIIINGTLMPFYSFTHASYFIIRSGGNTAVTMVFDSGFVWLLSVPLAFVLSRYTDMSVIKMVFLVQSLEIVKCISAALFVKSGIWAKNIT